MRKALIEATCANQAKADFLVTMSHKLRTPFNAIVGFSDMLAGQFDGPLGSKKYNKCAGAHQINLESINFNETAEDCMPIVMERAVRKGIFHDINVPKSLLTFQADQRAIKRMLLNPLSNAIKFTAGAGKKCCRCQRRATF